MEDIKNPWPFAADNPNENENRSADSFEMTSASVVVLSLESKESVLTKRVVEDLKSQKKLISYHQLHEITNEKLDTIKDQLQRSLFSQGFLTAHGESNDVNYIYYEDFEANSGERYPRGKSAQEISDMLIRILPNRNPVSLELLVCSAARTSQWKINHLKPMPRTLK